MKKLITYTLLLSAFTLTSCNLDEVPTSNIVMDESKGAITSDGELKVMLNGINTSFRSCQYGQPVLAEEVMCDGFNATANYGNTYGNIHNADATFTDSNYDSAAMWELYYVAIKDFNVFIKNANLYKPEAEASQTAVKQALGVAYFYRAYAYDQLIRHYAKAYNASTATSDLGVPLVLEFNMNEKPARATVKEVYDQIKKDLDEAAADLADVAGEVGSMTPTIDAVNALYARYYIDTKDYTNAALYSDKVINSAAGYKLASTAEEMTAEYTNDEGTEPIMQLAASLAEDGSGTNDIYTNADYYKGFAQYHGGIYFNPLYIPTKKLVDSYESGDLRLKQWYANDYVAYFPGGGTIGTFYTFTKYLGNPSLNSNGIPNARQKVKPMLIAEMYLINAEANFKLGKTAEAKKALNTLQTARQATATEATEDNIENEWFKETVGEGLRMSCLKRWGKGYSNRAAQEGAVEDAIIINGGGFTEKSMSADDAHWLWPIPSYERRVNSNLVQNPGY